MDLNKTKKLPDSKANQLRGAHEWAEFVDGWSKEEVFNYFFKKLDPAAQDRVALG